MQSLYLKDLFYLADRNRLLNVMITVKVSPAHNRPAFPVNKLSVLVPNQDNKNKLSLYQ